MNFRILLICLLTLQKIFAANTTYTELPETAAEVFAGRLSASVGMPVPLIKSTPHSFLLLAGMKSGNFDSTENVPWQMWAGTLGAGYEYNSKENNLKFSTGFIHQSEHVSDIDRFREKYIRAGGYFDNRSLRSYEYLFFAVNRRSVLDEKWYCDITIRMRIYTPPLNSLCTI